MTHSKQGGCSQPLLHCLLPQHATTIARLTASKVMQPALAALLVASTSHKNCMTHSKQGDAASPCCMACCFNKPQDLHDSQQAMWMQPALAACLVATTGHKSCMTHSKHGGCSQPLLHALLLL
jgi:hypothetical protein